MRIAGKGEADTVLSAIDKVDRVTQPRPIRWNELNVCESNRLQL
jgi:hypothetical protein